MTSVGILCHATVGGSVRIATHLATALSARGHDVTLFATKPPAFPLSASVSLRTVCHEAPHPRDDLAVTIGSSEFDRLTKLVIAAVAAAEVEVVHFHYALPFAALATAVRDTIGSGGVKIVGTLHGTDVSVHGAQRNVRHRLHCDLAATDALTTVSHSHAMLTRRRLRLEPVVIPNFVDLHTFRPTSPRPGAPPRILHMSNFRPVKNTLGVARAFARVRRMIDAELWLVGDGEMLPATLTELERAGVPPAVVRCFGMVRNPGPIVAQTDVLALPSYSESFGMAALEALACGLPVVGSRVGGLTELIDGAACGVLVDPGDDAALAAALAHALERRGAWRQGAIRRAAQYSIDRVVPMYERLYGAVLKRDQSVSASPRRSPW